MANRLYNNDDKNLICPYCGQALFNIEGKSMQCSSNHNFDFTKEGYLNLLPVNQKKSRKPGDNEMMIKARRAFLEGDFYQPLVGALNKLLTDEVNFSNQVALDLGCGEGYYTSKVLLELNSFKEIIGTDISKEAVRLAAKKYKHALFFVSSAFQLPLKSQSIDFVLSIFAPFSEIEIRRVLKEEGIIVIVSAGENHLKELAEVIYEKFRIHDNKIDSKMESGFSKITSTNIQFNLNLDSPSVILDLLKMTPYYWNNDRNKIEKLISMDNLDVTCHFRIDVFRAI